MSKCNQHRRFSPKTVAGNQLDLAGGILVLMEMLQDLDRCIPRMPTWGCDASSGFTGAFDDDDLMRPRVQRAQAIPREGLPVQDDDTESNAGRHVLRGSLQRKSINTGLWVSMRPLPQKSPSETLKSWHGRKRSRISPRCDNKIPMV